MGKNTENNFISRTSIASANSNLEEYQVSSTEFLSPPQLSFSANSALPMSRKKKEDKSEQYSSIQEINVVDSAQLMFNPIQDSANLVQQQKTTLPKEESKEDVQETQSIQLDFDTSSPIEPNDEPGNDGAPSGNLGDGSSGNPIQKKDPSGTPAAGSTSGNNMPLELQSKMEASMGADFSKVNIHTNSSSATDANALAFAQGNHVHFAPGQYNPNSNSGQELLGHELAHVKQQNEGRVQATRTVNGMAVNDSPILEKEADVLGAKAANLSTPVQGKFNSNNSIVQKKEDDTIHNGSKYNLLVGPIQKQDSEEEKKSDDFPINEVEIPLPMDNDQKIKISLNPMAGAEFSYSAAKFPPGSGPNMMDKPKDGGWSKKMPPITIPYGPGGLIATAEIGAELSAGLKGSFSVGKFVIPPFIKEGRQATLSGTADLTAKAEGEVGFGIYAGASIANIAAQGYLNVTGSIGTGFGLSGSAKWNPDGDMIEGAITLDVSLKFAVEASGGIKLTYYTPLDNGTFAKFELAKAPLGSIEIPIKAGVDLISGQQIGSGELKTEGINLSLPQFTQTGTITREEYEQKMGGSNNGGTGSPGYSYDEMYGQGGDQNNGNSGAGGSIGQYKLKDQNLNPTNATSVNQFKIDNRNNNNMESNMNSTLEPFSLSSGSKQNNIIQNKQDKAFSLNTPSDPKSVSVKNEVSNQFLPAQLKSESNNRTEIKQFSIANNADEGKATSQSQDALASANQGVNMAE